jgi:arylsulfatase A-like enzyme
MAVMGVWASGGDAPGAEPPNVVVIYADDLGYGDVQCYNPDRGRIPTPRIDRLAAQGMRFTDGHSSSGVCSPSRYTLLTGRYHWRSRQQAGIVPLWGPPLIAPDRMTLGTLARQHGYRTACIGKWHLGWDWPIPADRAAVFKAKPERNPKRNEKPSEGRPPVDDAPVPDASQREVWREVFSRPIGGGPVTRGFDVYFGTDVPNWPPFCFIDNDHTVDIPSEFLPSRLLRDNQASNQGPAIAGWTLEPILPALADRAAAFIGDAAGAAKPFLLYMPLTSPHTPLSVNDAWKGRSGLNTYADFVMETDAVVGRVLDALETSGVADKTLVVFSSDNGCAPYIGKPELEAMGHFPSGPLRGAKADAWEGGHRVPFIVRWPGVVAAGSVCHALVHQADLLRTFAEVLGATLPDDAGEDSVSLVPLLRGGDDPVREHAVSASIQGVPAIRKAGWKYIATPGSGGWGKGGDQSEPVQLYDLSVDLGETKNLAAAMPEKVSEMQSLLEELIDDGRSTPGTRQRNDVEVTRHPVRVGAKKPPAKERAVDPAPLREAG